MKKYSGGLAVIMAMNRVPEDIKDKWSRDCFYNDYLSELKIYKIERRCVKCGRVK